eukprot:COSAG04_NODE_5_length_50521_cov_24.772639_29_plen_333_part_00
MPQLDDAAVDLRPDAEAEAHAGARAISDGSWQPRAPPGAAFWNHGQGVLVSDRGTVGGAAGGATRLTAHAVPELAPVVDRYGRRYDGRKFWGQPFLDLVDHRSTLPVLREVLGDDEFGLVEPDAPPEQRHRIRLDHDNLHYKPGCVEQGASAVPDMGGLLHGGPSARHVTCVWELSDVGPGEGGFGCLPGSHVPAVAEALIESLPEGWRSAWCETPWTRKHPQWPASVPVHRVEAQSGDCIIFSERLLHGTIAWSARRPRRTIYYKYCPFGRHHSDAGYDLSDPKLSEQQRGLLEFPEVFYDEEKNADGEVVRTNGAALRWADVCSVPGARL